MDARKLPALRRALGLLLMADQTDFMGAARAHTAAARTVAPWAGCGPVGHAHELIRGGKTRLAVHALRNAIVRTVGGALR